jgi:hypothetical protein
VGWVTRRESPASQLEIGPGSEGLRFIRPLGWTLRQCGPPDHIVQLYQDQQFLNRAVCRFAASALANGEGVILVPTAAHWEAFKPRLEAEGVDIDRAKDAGQLTVVDADELLPQFMRDAMPDEAGGSRRVGESSRRRRRRTQRLIGCQVNIMLSTDVISEWGLAHSADASSARPEWDYAEKNRPAVSRCRRARDLERCRSP